MVDLENLILELDQSSKNAAVLSFTSDSQRKRLLEACTGLAGAIETPIEAATKLAFAIHPATAVRLGMNLGIFNAFATNTGKSLQIKELAKTTNAEPLLIVRVMRMLVALKMFQKCDDSSYTALPSARFYASGSPLGDAVYHFHDVHARVLCQLPEYLRVTGYRNPADASAGPFQHVFGTNLHQFDWLKRNPSQFAAFNSFMTAQRVGRGEEWYEYYPIKAKILPSKVTKANGKPTFVDVGGGKGHDIQSLTKFIGNTDIRFVLQDLAEVLGDVKDLDDRIECSAYNFFTPQIVQNANFYYLRTILHDWPDAQAMEILKNLHLAMAPESTLLINEFVLPDDGTQLLHTQLDLSMMAMFSSLERTEAQWTELLDRTGFRVVNIWRPAALEPDSASLIEARVKTEVERACN